MALDSNRPSDWWRNRPAGGGFEPTNALSQIISYCESRLANDDPEDNDIGARQGARGASNAVDAINPASEQRNHSPPEPPEPLSRPLASRPSRPALRLQQPGADQAESGCEQPGSVFEWSGYHSSVTPTYRILPTFGNRARPLPPTPISENDDLADSSHLNCIPTSFRVSLRHHAFHCCGSDQCRHATNVPFRYKRQCDNDITND